MRIHKNIFTLVSLAVITFVIYLSNAGFSTEKPVIEKSAVDKPSTYCTFNISVTCLQRLCLTGDYKYCINGGPTIPTSGSFTVDVPCETAVSVCVTSSNGCTGTLVLSGDCPCNDVVTYLYISNTGARCDCQ